MHGSEVFAADLAGSLADRMAGHGSEGVEMLLCPPALLLGAVRGAAVGTSGVAIGGQDCHVAEQGASSDIAAAMLADAGCGYVIVGHSERRADHGEDDALVQSKAEAAQAADLVPVVCIGETLDQRDAGTAAEVVVSQLRGSVPEGSSASTLVVASTNPFGRSAPGERPPLQTSQRSTVDQDVLTHDHRQGDGVRILYVESVKPINAAEILTIENVNGALVGGASLKADDFWAIAQSA